MTKLSQEQQGQPQDPNPWLTSNENFLAAALDWLKLRLQVQVGAIATSPAPGGNQFFKRATSPPPTSVSEYDVQQAAHRMAQAASAEPPPALYLLGQQLGLSRFEQQVLLLCAAVEFDTQIPLLCALAQDAPNRPYPTFALALSLFDQPTWDVVSHERPLRYWQLITVNATGTQPLVTSPLQADERIVNYLKGLNALDHRLSALIAPLTGDRPPPLPPSQQATVQQTLTALQRASRQMPGIVQLVGADPQSQQLIVQAVAAELDLYPYRLAAHLLPTALSELKTLERLCQRESRLLPILFYLDANQMDVAESGQSKPLVQFLSHSQCLFLVGTRDIQPGLGQPGSVVDVGKPTAAEQTQLWMAALEQAEMNGGLGDRHHHAALLSGQFRLNAGAIHQIAASAAWAGEEAGMGTPESIGDYLWHTCQIETRPQLSTLAQRLHPCATWEDIVLPDDERQILQQIADQVRHRNTVYEEWGFHRRMNRGLGISTLFVGESGTGKTMAAEVIANELRLDLYRIDLSSVVSKYIGETEKNLRRLFDAAEDGGAILFFDEADALFGKRSEVKDSHDRYANIEINYLLQRIESYRGLAILATNFKNAIDTAFLRRLRFVVQFPFPGVKERQTIWQKAFPPETPQADLNFKQLARFNLTGGNIHNIVLNAAFLAAQAQTPVTMAQVLTATRGEFRKLDRPINEADFLP
ncbi:MAG: ATP-binding protein [Synechococcales bacterium]|nr:ATP-binding protein [Synechococcales bacterium]